jgi:hypothetical protein
MGERSDTHQQPPAAASLRAAQRRGNPEAGRRGKYGTPHRPKALSFLKKKQQKNVCSLRAAATPAPHPLTTKSFLLLFFKKEALASA